jgi:hypothetical protein
MNADRTFPFQKFDHHRNAVFRRDAQQHVDAIRSRVPFQQFDSFLSAQLTKNSANLFTEPSKHFPTPIFWHNDNMVFADPLHVGLTPPILHSDPPSPLGAFLWEDRFIFTQDTAEPVQFSPAELVD